MNDNDTATSVTIYTDGACSGNPGPGGWGAVLLAGTHRRELKGGERETTNNRMEMMAAIMALDALKRRSTVDLHTDSTYLRQGITQWIHNWKRNGWKTADRKDVKNADLWQRLDTARRQHDINWHWVKGHAGDPLNERADELARLGLKQAVNGGGVEPETDAQDPSGAAPSDEFALDPRLAADTLAVGRLELSSLRLMNDRRYKWLILVPQRSGLVELGDLEEPEAAQLMREIRAVSAVLTNLYAPEKINVGALGNIVRQLHVHVIARSAGDPAWPGPVWGHGPAEPYAADELAALQEELSAALDAC